jgi:hypothetical protein
MAVSNCGCGSVKPKADRLQERRRHIAGPTGCGLCGIDSIAEALRSAAVMGLGRQFSSDQIMAAMRKLPLLQKLNTETRAIHAAAFWNSTSGIVALREDVGRHNALDKLSGALARASAAASEGIILLTSRVSVEMVQKSAVIGAPVMVSVSAPTALPFAWPMQQVSHLQALRARTDSKCSRILAGFHLALFPLWRFDSLCDRFGIAESRFGFKHMAHQPSGDGALSRSDLVSRPCVPVVNSIVLAVD